MEQLKTYILMVALMVLFVWFGGMFGGATGMVIAFVVAMGMNFYAYYYSDQQVLKHYDATPVDSTNAPELYHIVQRLTTRANLPMPALYIINEPQPNAFATGRDYEHAAVAVTTGLMDLMDEQELQGVIAHELSHIKHKDILIGTVAAALAGAISMLANFGMFFGGGDRENGRGANPIVMIALMFLMPLAASVVQMSVSRSREYLADEGAARITGHPEWLQSALSKLEHYSHQIAMEQATQQSAHMFIINPFNGMKSFSNLFRTHPTTQERIERLEALK